MNKEISKKLFWRYVNLKIKRSVHHYHVFAVLSILFEEIAKDLDSGKELNIFNLGTLILKPIKSKTYHDVRFRKVMISTKKNRSLKFNLSKKIKEKLIKLAYIDEGKKSD